MYYNWFENTVCFCCTEFSLSLSLCVLSLEFMIFRSLRVRQRSQTISGRQIWFDDYPKYTRGHEKFVSVLVRSGWSCNNFRLMNVDVIRYRESITRDYFFLLQCFTLSVYEVLTFFFPQQSEVIITRYFRKKIYYFFYNLLMIIL